MSKSPLLPLMFVGLTGCAGMINKKIESAFADNAWKYNNEDVDAIMEEVPDDFVRRLPSGQVIEGRDAYRAYLSDLFAVSENIDLQVQDALRDGDVIILVYRWSADIVAPSAYTVDMTGSHIDTPAIGVLTLGPGRTIVRIDDYYDRAFLAADAGYTLVKPAPVAATLPPALPTGAALPDAEGASD